MSEPEPEPERGEKPGMLHSISPPLSHGLRFELHAAIESIYAATDGPDTSTHSPAPKAEVGSCTSATHHDGAHALSPLETACERLTKILHDWRGSIEKRNLQHQLAIYQLHPPGNPQDFQRCVSGQNMSDADSALVARLRQMCPKLGFEVLPVLLEYTGTTCHYNAWVSRPSPSVPVADLPIGEDGYWKTYQHVRHTPRLYRFGSFSGSSFAEDISCKDGNVLDGRHVAWERARRGVFSQLPHEQRLIDEEHRARKTNPKWYQNIIPGTTANIGTYSTPAIMIAPLDTHLELINLAKKPQPVSNIWGYLLMQCVESVVPEIYFEGFKKLCYYALPKQVDTPLEIRTAGMMVRSRQDWVDAIDQRLLGRMITTSLLFKDKELFEHLAAQAPVHPKLDYTWLFQNATIYGYSVAAALKELRQFLFQGGKFFQIACIINKMPAYPDDSEDSEIATALVKEALTIPLNDPVSASHGRAIADFLKYFKNLRTWSETVNTVINQPRELWRNTPFIFGLLNRLLEVAKRDGLPLDQVKAFYRKYEDLAITTDSLGQVGNLVSNALKDQSCEAKIARQTWREPEPTDEDLRDQSATVPTSFAVIASLFRSLDRLDMDEEVAKLVQHIIKRQDEIRPINMATFWMPCLCFLQDLVDETPTWQKLFQTIFELYHKMVFKDDSLQFEDAPESVSPMALCCDNCKYLDAYLEQPGWKMFHVMKPRTVIEHIQDQLREQKKPIETKVYGKNELSMTMQLNKASLVNKELRSVIALRKQEATRAVRKFDPERLLPFLGNKGDIMWKLGNADSPESSAQKTPARSGSVDTTSSSGSGLSRTSSSSCGNTSVGSAATPCRDSRDPIVKREIGSDLDSATSRVRLKTQPGSESTHVKVKGTHSSSAQLPEDTGDTFAFVMNEKTPGSSQGKTKTASGLSIRDRLKNLQPSRLESPPKFNDYLNIPTDRERTERIRGSLASSQGPTLVGASSSSSTISEPSTRRDPLASFGGVRSKEPVRNGIRKSVFSRDRSAAPRAATTGLANRANADSKPMLSSSLASSPHAASVSFASSSRTSAGVPDFMSAVLDAELAIKGRSNKLAREIRTASGNVVSSGMSSGKLSFDGLAEDKKNTRTAGQGKQSTLPALLPSKGVLAARSPNVRTGGGGALTSHGSKRKADDADIIDLCSSSPEPAAGKRPKRAAVFDPLDDDPFAD